MPRVDHRDLDGEELRQRRPVRPRAVVLEVPLLRRRAARGCRTRTQARHERARRRAARRAAASRNRRSSTGPGQARGPAQRGRGRCRLPAGLGALKVHAPVSSVVEVATVVQAVRPSALHCSCTGAAATAGFVVPAATPAAPCASTRSATAILARPARTSPQTSRYCVATCGLHDRRERTVRVEQQVADRRPVEPDGFASSDTLIRAACTAGERERAAVGHRLRRRQQLQQRRREPGRAQLERAAHLVAGQRHLRVVLRYDGQRSSRGPTVPSSSAGRRSARRASTASRQRPRRTAPVPSRGTATPCRTDRRQGRGTGRRRPSTRAPTRCARRRSRRRACSRPCPCRGRPGPSSRRPRRSSRRSRR